MNTMCFMSRLRTSLQRFTGRHGMPAAGPGRRRVAQVGLALGIAMIAVVGAANQTPTPYVVVRGTVIPGREVRADRTGRITLITATGPMTFEAGTTVVMDEPAALAGLRKQIEEGQFAEAIPGLRSLINEYRFLGWDNRIRRDLARAQVGAEQHDDAVKTLEELFANQPAARSEPVVQNTYLHALKGAGEREKLLPLLDEVIRDGGRASTALAQMMRGNMLLESGEVERALHDFLRTATLFRSVRELQPEALYRTAACFEQLGYTEQAQHYYGLLKDQYPDSEFARQL